MFGSLALGLVAAVLLVLVPFGPPTQSAVIGSMLCGFAVGWGMLAVLTARFTDQPQRWAFVPAALMGLSGLLLVLFGPAVQPALTWILPPAMLAVSIYMMIRIRQNLSGSRARWLLYPVIVALGLASVGAGYQAIGEALDTQATPMPGQLIDVGGHRLHLYCSGSGGPTVVLEAGGGAAAAELELLRSAVERDTHVCVYDRAGRGWSDSTPTPAHGIQIATDLHTLLERAQVPRPYVLVGHSFGGLYVQMFAARYPTQVAGMVLIDSTAPDAGASAYQTHPVVLDRVFALLSSSAQLGLGHLFGGTARDLLSSINEYADAGDAVQHAASLTDFGDKPLFVLTAGIGGDAAKFAAQDRMAALSSDSVHRTVENASHQMLVSDEESAAVTACAILDVAAAVRSGQPLAK
ncbi:alpha/beta hydrolase [Microbacterium sp. BK668]|uniref:alpha/beta fold hydrolase n=1 Tax=Microbacterium sp. BK668 TaxID=2512118 RepID=UPI00105B9DA1|nr:alpha/beta hydrolase [Microbacterium sp. BK668]